MSFLTIIGIALGLAMDAFAVAIASGISLPRLTFRHFFRLSFHFGLFQFMMPIFGWFAGRTFAEQISSVDHWVAFGLLALIGGKMIRESFGDAGADDTQEYSDPTRKLSLIILSVATSIDALAVGVSLALLEVDIWFPSVIIGLVAALMTTIGLAFGRKLGSRFGRRMGLIGGLVLIAIGLRILLGELFV